VFITYRGYSSASGECALTETAQALETEFGVEYALRRRWVIDGQVQADSPGATVARLMALANAFSVWGFDITLRGDDGTLVKTLTTGDSLTGVKIVQPPGWPTGGGAQLTTFADYQVVAEADYPLGSNGATYRSFSETVTFSGGGPRRVLVECVNSPPQWQTLYAQTIFRATQSGQAVGLYGYPPVPPPLWPVALLESPRLSKGTPRRMANLLMEFPVSWSYEFGSPFQLSGGPNPVPPR
jgi:hypothetical protein